MTEEEAIKLLQMLKECLMFYKMYGHLHGCNDCGYRTGCKYLPKWGLPVRLNCPLWEEEE